MRESAIKEREHKRNMKRYRDAVVMAEMAKKRKMDTSGTGDNYVADTLTVSAGAPKPQMLVVKDHFRKAKILSGVSDRTIEKIKDNIRHRWDDLVQAVFPTITIIDIHGVKTWALNFSAVTTEIMEPFFKLRYGVKFSWAKMDRGSSSDSPKDRFFEACDDLITGLLVNNNAGLIIPKEILAVFKSSNTHEGDKVVYSGIERVAQ